MGRAEIRDRVRVGFARSVAPRRDFEEIKGSPGGIDQCIGRVPLSKIFEEELRADHALAIQDEGARMGHALRLAACGRVADVIGLDRPALGIGEHREADLHAVGEGLQGLGIVITEADNLDTGGFDRLEVALQLDQLRAAVGSPVGRAVEHQGDLALAEEFLQRALLALLILEGELRRLLADLQAGILIGRASPWSGRRWPVRRAARGPPRASAIVSGMASNSFADEDGIESGGTGTVRIPGTFMRTAIGPGQ